jgi:threonine dehydrogenase-like Zn-dependent dehydrogenase
VGQVVTFEGLREVGIREYEERPLQPNEVRLQTLYSGISAGTEPTAYKESESIPYLSKRWDDDRRLFLEGGVSLRYPIEGGATGRSARWRRSVRRSPTSGPGRSSGAWGHKGTTVVYESWAAQRKLAPDVDPMVGIFSRIGAIALNAVVDADVHRGEYVGVFGQGVPGLIAAQLASLNGGTVIAVDGMPKRLELAKELGAAHVIDFTKGSPLGRSGL